MDIPKIEVCVPVSPGGWKRARQNHEFKAPAGKVLVIESGDSPETYLIDQSSSVAVNVAYCITCEKCKLQYIGQTTRSLDERVRENISI